MKYINIVYKSQYTKMNYGGCGPINSLCQFQSKTKTYYTLVVAALQTFMESPI